MNQLLEVYLHSVRETHFFQLHNPERAFTCYYIISCLNPSYGRFLTFSASKLFSFAYLAVPPKAYETSFTGIKLEFSAPISV